MRMDINRVGGGGFVEEKGQPADVMVQAENTHLESGGSVLAYVHRYFGPLFLGFKFRMTKLTSNIILSILATLELNRRKTHLF